MGGYPILGSAEFPDYPPVPHNGIIDVKVDTTDPRHPIIMAVQTWAIKASVADIAKNRYGVTNPDLHRYIGIHNYIENRVGDFVELAQRRYKIGIFGLDSHRYTERTVRDYGPLDPMADNPNNVKEIP